MFSWTLLIKIKVSVSFGQTMGSVVLVSHLDIYVDFFLVKLV